MVLLMYLFFSGHMLLSFLNLVSENVFGTCISLK